MRIELRFIAGDNGIIPIDETPAAVQLLDCLVEAEEDDMDPTEDCEDHSRY